MKKLNVIYRAERMPVIDRYTIESEGITSWDLMERAAGCWAAFFEKAVDGMPPVAVVAGKGNNGGDGFAIARMLAEAGWEVEVACVEGFCASSGDCMRNAELWREMGGRVVAVAEPGQWTPAEDAVVVDALFGTGLNRPVEGLAAGMIRRMNELPNPVYAVDVPSGLMCEDNSGNDRTAVVRAEATFTFGFPKLAFLLPENEEYVGEWHVLDIGLETGGMEADWHGTDLEAAGRRLPRSRVFAHKGMNGRGLLGAGSRGMMGAAVLGARGAVHSGIGVLHCHVPAGCGEVMQAAVPEAVLEADVSECCFSGVKEEDLTRWNAVAVGPGIGKGEETVEGVRRLLQEWRGRLILDADALNILAEHRELLECLHGDCLLTPHVKEFERLAGKCGNDFERLNKLLTFAKRYQVHVVLKGAYSAVAVPEGRLYFNMSGNPGMAKGGSGDVLTGVLLALAANGMPMGDVARAGVFAHGLSGDLLAERVGQRGVTAGVLAENMGCAWKVMEETKY